MIVNTSQLSRLQGTRSSAHIHGSSPAQPSAGQRDQLCGTGYDLLVENKTEENKVQLKVPEHLQVRPVTPVETYIKVGPSPAIPQTTQGLIGWRSTIAELQLEHYGRSKYLKGDFCKSMNWPAEGLS
ncbi:ciliary microtubule inner protein 1 isoform X2 [Pseudophryne corroboree]|uniref:ciliary microtubule inner protein 1 isoform X2 n=1 Tax=Pseudophryne corroboree TaxID=495146 RepID=UPI003081DB53